MGATVVSPLNVFEGFFGAEIRELCEADIDRLSNDQLSRFLEEARRYVASAEVPWDDQPDSLRPYARFGTIGTGTLNSSGGKGPLKGSETHADALMNELRHWLLYCHAVAIDSPLQFTPTAPDAARQHLSGLLAFLQAAAPLLRSGTLVLLEGSSRWLEWSTGPRLSEDIAARHIAEEAERVEHGGSLRAAFDPFSGQGEQSSDDIHSFIDKYREFTVLDAVDARVEERLIDAFDELDHERYAQIAWEQTIGKDLNAQPDSALGRSLLRQFPDSLELTQLLLPLTSSSMQAIDWSEEIQTRLAASAFNTPVDIVWPMAELEEAYRLTLTSWSRAPTAPATEWRTLNRLLSVELPRLPDLQAEDIVSLRETSEEFESWRRALRTGLQLLPEATEGGLDEAELRAILADGTFSIGQARRRSGLLSGNVPDALSLSVGGVAATLLGDPSALVAASASLLVAGAYRWLGARQGSRSSHAVHRHHLVFEP